MKVSLVFITMIMLLVSCSTATKTLTADALTAVATTAIVNTATCEAVDVVRADVKTKVDAWFKINQQEVEKGIVAEICKVAIKSIVPELIGATLKPEWKCNLTTLNDAANVLSEIACKDIKI